MVSGGCFAGRVPLGSPPSPPRLRSRGLVRRVRRDYGAIRLPMTVHPRITASAFPERPALVTSQPGGHGLSRFSRMEVPHLPWFSHPPGPPSGPPVSPPPRFPSPPSTPPAP